MHRRATIRLRLEQLGSYEKRKSIRELFDDSIDTGSEFARIFSNLNGNASEADSSSTPQEDLLPRDHSLLFVEKQRNCVMDISDQANCIIVGKNLNIMVQAVADNSRNRSAAWMCRNTSDPTCPRLMKHPNVEIPSIDAKITCVAVFENMFASLESRDNFLAVVVGFSGGHLQIYSVEMPLSATRLTGSWPMFAASPQDDAKTASLVVTTQSYDAAVSKIMCTQSDRSNGGRKRVWCLHSDGVLTSLLPPVKPAASPVPEKVQLCFMISTDPLRSIRAFQGQTVADALGNHRICPHKWVLKGQRRITDIAFSCHCANESADVSFFATSNDVSVVAVGLHPCVASYRLCAVNTDSSDQTEPENDSDVAEEPVPDDHGKAQAVTSFVSGWLGWGAKKWDQATGSDAGTQALTKLKKVAKQARHRLPGAAKASAVAGDNELVQQTAVHVSGRIFDRGRHITRICMEPSGVFAACTDLQGRVLLLNVSTFSVVRVFKGYRDAQVGWTHGCLLDPRTAARSVEARALYLSIYAPRKSTIEIWRAATGPRSHLLRVPALPVEGADTRYGLRLATAVDRASGAVACVVLMDRPFFAEASATPNTMLPLWIFGPDTTPHNTLALAHVVAPGCRLVRAHVAMTSSATSDAVLYRTCPDLMRRLLHLHRQRKQQRESKQAATDDREMLEVWTELLALLNRIRSPDALMLAVVTVERHALALHTAPWMSATSPGAKPKLEQCLCHLVYEHVAKALARRQLSDPDTVRELELENIRWKIEMLNIYRHLWRLASRPTRGPTKVEAGSDSFLAKAIGSTHLANEIRQWMRCAELTQQTIEQRVNNAEAVPGATDIKYASFLEFMCIHSIRPASRSRADSVCAMWSACSLASSIREFAASVCHRILLAHMHAQSIPDSSNNSNDDEQPPASKPDRPRCLSQAAKIWTHLPPQSAAQIFTEWWWWWTCHRGRTGAWARGWLWREFSPGGVNDASSESDTQPNQAFWGMKLLSNAVDHIRRQLQHHGVRAYSRGLRSCVDATTAASDEHDPSGSRFDIVLLTRRPLAALALAQLVFSALTTAKADQVSEKTDRSAEAGAWRCLQSHARKLLLLRYCLLFSPRAPKAPKRRTSYKSAASSAERVGKGARTSRMDAAKADPGGCVGTVEARCDVTVVDNVQDDSDVATVNTALRTARSWLSLHLCPPPPPHPYLEVCKTSSCRRSWLLSCAGNCLGSASGVVAELQTRLHSEDLIALPHIYAEAEAGEDNTTDAAHPGFPWRCTSAETTRLRQSNCNEVSDSEVVGLLLRRWRQHASLSKPLTPDSMFSLRCLPQQLAHLSAARGLLRTDQSLSVVMRTPPDILRGSNESANAERGDPLSQSVLATNRCWILMQQWFPAPDQVPVLSRAVAQLHRVCTSDDEPATVVLRCALAFAIWENFLRPILSELFPYSKGPSTKKSVLNPLIVIPMLNSCQQIVQAMTAYAKQASSKNAADVSTSERLSLSEFGHNPLCAACLRLLLGCADSHPDRRQSGRRLADSALEALKLFFKIVAAMISFRSRLLPSHSSNRDAHPIELAPWHALDVLGGGRNVLAPKALMCHSIQAVGSNGNPKKNPVQARQSRVIRLLLLLDGQLAHIVANWLRFPTDQLVLTEVESLYLRSEDALATDVWRPYTRAEAKVNVGTEEGNFSSVSDTLQRGREELQTELGLLILQIARERLSLLVENMRGSKYEPIARSMRESLLGFRVAVPPRHARARAHKPNRSEIRIAEMRRLNPPPTLLSVVCMVQEGTLHLLSAGHARYTYSGNMVETVKILHDAVQKFQLR